MFNPWPGIVLQFTPSVKPAAAQVAAVVSVPTTALPGKERYFDAILPTGAKAAKAGVSNQAFPCCGEAGSRGGSQVEEQDVMVLLIGSPAPPAKCSNLVVAF